MRIAVRQVEKGERSRRHRLIFPLIFLLGVCLSACGDSEEADYPDVEPTLAVDAESQAAIWSMEVYAEGLSGDEGYVVVPYNETDGYACFALTTFEEVGCCDYTIGEVGSYTVTVEKGESDEEGPTWGGELWAWDELEALWLKRGRYTFFLDDKIIQLSLSYEDDAKYLEETSNSAFNAEEIIQKAGLCALVGEDYTPAPFATKKEAHKGLMERFYEFLHIQKSRDKGMKK